MTDQEKTTRVRRYEMDEHIAGGNNEGFSFANTAMHCFRASKLNLKTTYNLKWHSVDDKIDQNKCKALQKVSVSPDKTHFCH